jgi:hypothetical protein
MRLRLDLDTTNRIDSLDSVCMMDPFNVKSSAEEVIDNISIFDFFTQVYPDKIIEELLEQHEETGLFSLPKCIFMPEKHIMKTFIHANLKYARTDNIE